MSPARILPRRWSSPGVTWQVSLQLLREYRAELSAFAVTPPQAAALLYLQHNPGSSIRQCARVVGVTAPTMGEIVKRIQQKGWLRKQRAPQDDRYVLLTVTPKGTHRVRKILRLLQVARAIRTPSSTHRHAVRTPAA